MKTLAWVLTLFALAVLVSLVNAQLENYYVSFFLPSGAYSFPYPYFVLMCLAILIGSYFVLRLFFTAINLPSRVKAYQLARQQRKLWQSSQAAQLAFYQGRVQKAAQAAQEALDADTEDSLSPLHHLLAARASHAFRSYAKRDAHLDALDMQNQEIALAVHITRAQLYLDQHEFNLALDAVLAAKAISPKLTAAMLLELKIRHRLKQAEHTLELIDQLEKSEALDASSCKHYRLAAYIAQLRTLSLQGRKLTEWWNAIPNSIQQEYALREAYFQALLADKQSIELLKVMQIQLKHVWDSQLIHYLTDLRCDSACHREALKWLESVLPQHSEDALLLRFIAELCRQQSLWGKAQTYAEASLALQPSAAAHLLLAELAEQQEKPELAHQHYRAGLHLVQGR